MRMGLLEVESEARMEEEGETKHGTPLEIGIRVGLCERSALYEYIVVILLG